MTSDTKFWKALALALVLAGSLIRIRQVAARQSFWNDEAFIVLNVLHHSDRQLIGHLDYDQAAPPVFLWIERLMAVHFGANEYALRAQALFCGIALLAIFSALAWRVLPPGPAVGAIALVVFSDKLVQYCVEVKQYSGDAMIAALLIWLAVSISTDRPGKRILIVALVSSIAIWFSHTTSIIFGGISLVILISILRRKDWRGFAVWIGANAIFALSLAALYLLSIRHQHTQFLYEFWAKDLPDLKRPLAFPGWLLMHIYEAFDFPYPFAGGWVIALSVGGIYWLIKNGKGEVAGFCLAPIALTALAAVLQQYPFNGSRLTLFLIPCILLLAGAGGALALDILPATVKWAWPAAVAPLLIMGIGEQGYRIFNPRYRSHIRPAVQYVQKHREPGDAVYMAGTGELPARLGEHARHLELLCYWPDPPPPFSMEWAPAATTPYRRFWLVFPFKPGQGKRLTNALLHDAEASADLRDHFVTPHGGAAYLFEKKGDEAASSQPATIP